LKFFGGRFGTVSAVASMLKEKLLNCLQSILIRAFESIHSVHSFLRIAKKHVATQLPFFVAKLPFTQQK
jgi:hypothetical protein